MHVKSGEVTHEEGIRGLLSETEGQNSMCQHRPVY
jgi:hypothetical protein